MTGAFLTPLSAQLMKHRSLCYCILRIQITQLVEDCFHCLAYVSSEPSETCSRRFLFLPALLRIAELYELTRRSKLSRQTIKLCVVAHIVQLIKH